MQHLRILVAALGLAWLGVSVGATPAWAGPLEDLPPGTWLEAPDSHLAPHMAPSTPDDWGGSASVMTAWCGGAYDTKRDRLIIWGGGHHDYAGNEIYVFDIATLAWSRLTDRSQDVGGDEASGYYPDGLPRSRHTYDYIQYVPSIDRFCSFGGTGLFPSGQGGVANVDCFDFDTLTWERKADTLSASIGAVSSVDPTNGHAWLQGAGNGLPLAEWDPQADTWTAHVKEPSGWFTYSHTADIDAKRQKLVAIGGGEVVVWDLTAPSSDPIRLQTSGATTIQEAGNPGVAYDPVSDRIVAWNGGADVYTLDLDTAAWELHQPAADNTVMPTSAAANGTYGRFRYVPSKNVFVVVNAIDQDVYFYKLSPGSGVVPDAGAEEDGQAQTDGQAEADGSAQDAGSGGSGGNSSPDAGATAGSGGSAGGGKAAATGDQDSGGCGCRTSPHPVGWPLVAGLIGPALLVWRRRRRPRVTIPRDQRIVFPRTLVPRARSG